MSSKISAMPSVTEETLDYDDRDYRHDDDKLQLAQFLHELEASEPILESTEPDTLDARTLSAASVYGKPMSQHEAQAIQARATAVDHERIVSTPH